MNHEEGIALLLKVARIEVQDIAESEMKAAHTLLENFGYLALAIVHAGAYIAHSPHISIPKYWNLFQAQRQRMLEQYSRLKVKLDEYGKSVYTTWRMCYDLLEQDGNAQRLFWLLAYLHHDGINEEMFQRATTNILSYQPELSESEVEKEACSYMRDYLTRFTYPEGGWDTLQFSDAITELASYSLIDFDRANLTYSIHVLVQDWARTVIPQSRDFAIECTTALLSRSIDWNDALESLIFRRRLRLHVDKVLQERHGEIGANHAAGFAEVYGVNGRWSQQEALEIHLKDTRTNELGREHPSTLTSMSNLALMYSYQGRLDEAESLGMQVINARERVLGEEHPDTLLSMGNLGAVYFRAGRWDKAVSLGTQVLNARKRMLGAEHPDTLWTMNNLSTAYRYQGQWDKAESLGMQVANARKRLLGEDHPQTLTSMNELAVTYWNQGRRDESVSMVMQVMNARKRVLGEDHPHTLNSMNQLALMYSDQGRLGEAELMQVEVMNAAKRVLGKDHPDTLASMSNVALTYRNQGRWDEAVSLGLYVIKAFTRVLSEEHPDTLTSIFNLALTYQKQGRFDEAEVLLAKVVDARARTIGDQHPDTLQARQSLENIQLQSPAKKVFHVSSPSRAEQLQVPQSFSSRATRIVPFLHDLVLTIPISYPSAPPLLFLFLSTIIALVAYMYVLR